jgi:hypothetical protein
MTVKTGRSGTKLLFLTTLLAAALLFSVHPPSAASTKGAGPVVILPLDARNQTYDYVDYIARICGYTPILPPRELMGNINPGDVTYRKQWNIWYWLNRTLDSRSTLLILSADSFVYGGLIESRQSPLSLEDALNNVKLLRRIRNRFPVVPILVFTSIPRREALHRERNLAVNFALMALAREKVIDFLSVSSDDATDISSQVQEISLMREYVEEEELEERVILPGEDRMRLGIDESAMALFMRWLNGRRPRQFTVYPEFRDMAAARMTIDHYSATPVMSVVLDMVEVLGARVVYEPGAADLVVAVNHPVRESNMADFVDRINRLLNSKPVALAEFSPRREAADFFEEIFRKGIYARLAGYAAWGMGTNSAGTALCQGLASLYCRSRESYAVQTAFLYERLASDYLYLGRIHLRLAEEENVPSYSLETMTGEKEKEVVRLASREFGQGLAELGIAYNVIEPGNTGVQPSGGEESSGPTCCGFTVALPPNGYGAGTARITLGPFSFPFHRLFEILIPSSAVLNQ